MHIIFVMQVIYLFFNQVDIVQTTKMPSDAATYIVQFSMISGD